VAQQLPAFLIEDKYTLLSLTRNVFLKITLFKVRIPHRYFLPLFFSNSRVVMELFVPDGSFTQCFPSYCAPWIPVDLCFFFRCVLDSCTSLFKSLFPSAFMKYSDPSSVFLHTNYRLESFQPYALLIPDSVRPGVSLHKCSPPFFIFSFHLSPLTRGLFFYLPLPRSWITRPVLSHPLFFFYVSMSNRDFGS